MRGRAQGAVASRLIREKLNLRVAEVVPLLAALSRQVYATGGIERQATVLDGNINDPRQDAECPDDHCGALTRREFAYPHLNFAVPNSVDARNSSASRFV